MMNTKKLLRHSTPGSHVTVRQHIQRGERIASYIGQPNPYRWKRSQIIHFLHYSQATHANTTHAHYQRTLILMLVTMGKRYWYEELQRLGHLPIRKGNAGRPAKHPHKQ